MNGLAASQIRPIDDAKYDAVDRRRRLEALERLSHRAARGEFEPTIRAYEARKRVSGAESE